MTYLSLSKEFPQGTAGEYFLTENARRGARDDNPPVAKFILQKMVELTIFQYVEN